MTEQPEVVEFEFINKTGLDLKLCISIFGDLLKPYNKTQEPNDNIISLGAFGPESIKPISVSYF